MTRGLLPAAGLALLWTVPLAGAALLVAALVLNLTIERRKA